MKTINQPQLAASKHGINYYITYTEGIENGRCYGILAEMINDTSDCNKVEGLFFTKSEAEEYCKWFADNEVYPVSLKDVLCNIYHL